jgi:hypothetical protein
MTAGRLAETSRYRGRYAEKGDEGFYIPSIRAIKKLIMNPFKYFAVDGKAIIKALRDKENRADFNWEAIGTKDGGIPRDWLDTYPFSVEMYTALSEGLSSAVGERLVDLVKIRRVGPKGVFTTDIEYLDPNNEGIRKIGKFFRKVIGYYIDRFSAKASDILGENGEIKEGTVRDPQVWECFKEDGIDLATPLFKMLNIPEATKRSIIDKVKKGAKFKAELRKVYGAMMMVEELKRLRRDQIDIHEIEGLLWIFANISPKAYDATDPTRSAEEVLDAALSTGDSSAKFGFTEDEVIEIIFAAGMKPRSPIETFLGELGGR